MESRRKMRNYLDLFWEFAINDFKLRYRRSYIGILWAIFKPLFQFIVLYSIWIGLFQSTHQHFLTILYGMVLYTLFSDTLFYGMNSLFNKSHIILKIYFPREIVVIAAASVAVINYLFNLGIVMVLMKMFGIGITYVMLKAMLIGALFTFLLALGFALWLSVLRVRFRDIEHIVELVVYMLFWLTPILYDISMLQGKSIVQVVTLNPLTSIVSFVYTAIAHEGGFGTLGLRYVAVWIILLFGLGLLYFRRNIKGIAEYY